MQSPDQQVHLSERNYDELCSQSWTLCDNFLLNSFYEDLLVECLRRESTADSFHASQIGKNEQKGPHTEIRNDSISWIDFENHTLWSNHIQIRLNEMLTDLNQHLHLGIDHFECHFAKYPKGSFYRTHLDQSSQMVAGGNERVISFVIYLNKDWQEADGGMLQIEMPGHENVLIKPTFGSMILFLSDTVPHSVLEAKNVRRSLTGWLRKSKVP